MSFSNYFFPQFVYGYALHLLVFGVHGVFEDAPDHASSHMWDDSLFLSRSICPAYTDTGFLNLNTRSEFSVFVAEGRFRSLFGTKRLRWGRCLLHHSDQPGWSLSSGRPPLGSTYVTVVFFSVR